MPSPLQRLVLRILNVKVLLRTFKALLTCMVFFLGGSATSLPEGAFNRTSHPRPSRALVLLCLEKHILWQHRYLSGSRGHCCVSITNTQASGCSPFHMRNFIGAPCVESLLAQNQELQGSLPRRLGPSGTSA